MSAKFQSLRQSTRSQTCRAFSTSVAAQEGTHSLTLPPAKLRALITLYHLSSSFITPANLSRHIDNAFAASFKYSRSGTSYMTYEGLQTRVDRNREKLNPPLLYKNVELYNFGAKTWSGMRGQRQSLLSAALWGIQSRGRPSLETVQETSSTNEELWNLLDQTADKRRL